MNSTIILRRRADGSWGITYFHRSGFKTDPIVIYGSRDAAIEELSEE